MRQKTSSIYQKISIQNTVYQFLIIHLVILTLSCGNAKEEIKAGSICTIKDGEGKYGVVKVLVIDTDEAHLKIYKNKYDQRPSKIDLKTLSLESINDKDGFGIGHVPLERSGFDNWDPILVGYEEVTKSDLEGYEMWKNR